MIKKESLMKMIKVKDEVHNKLKGIKQGSFSDTILSLMEKDDSKGMIKEAVKEAIQEEKDLDGCNQVKGKVA